MKLLKKIFAHILSPVALGLAISASTALIAQKNFYEIEQGDEETELAQRQHNPIYDRLKSLHDHSIDYRLQARGPRKGDKRVAVLAVDEESIKEIGRWPWPRSRISEVIERALGYGASVIGFDIVFSENQENTTQNVLYRLRDTATTKSPVLIPQIDEEILKSNHDKLLVDTVSKHKEQLIIGAFTPQLPIELEEKLFALNEKNLAPYESATFQEICQDTFFKSSYTMGMWDNSSSYVGGEDFYLNALPHPIREPFVEVLTKTLREINQNVIRTWLKRLSGGIKDYLPTMIADLDSAKQVKLLAYFFNEDLISIEEQGTEAVGYEVTREAAIEALNRFRLLIPHSDRIKVLAQMQEDQLVYCANWLSPADPHLRDYEKIWQTARNTHPQDMQNLDFNSFLASLKSPFLISKNIIHKTFDWTMNIPAISNVSANIGYFNAELDGDGTIRRTRLFTRFGTRSYMPSLALRTYATAFKLDALPIIRRMSEDPTTISPTGMFGVELAERTEGSEQPRTRKIPTTARGEIYINYAGKQKMFPHISVKELISDSEEMIISERTESPDGMWEIRPLTVNKRDFMKDKILIFGATAIAVFDLRLTPFEENYPGVETHANAVDNLIRQDYLLTDARESIYMPWILFGVGALLSFALGWLSATWSLVATAVSLFLIYYVDRHFYFENGIITAIIFPLLLVSSIFVALTFYRYVTEERKKKELRTTFAKYVSPQIVNEVLADPENLQLGGRKEHMTVFFSDVRGFTSISEKLDPQALSDLLNEYLTPMTEIVFANRGTLDKYMGDAVMAFFGAPIATATHAQDACRCALQSIEKVFELQRQFRQRGLPVIDIGIGLNTGEMSVGNMGSDIVRNYTVMGDAVNLGSRLEGLNKEYGTRIIMSEFTQAEIGDSFSFREIDWVRVKGKDKPVRIYELLGEQPSTELTRRMLECFTRGFQLYHERAWQAALQEFTQALDIQPNDPVSQLYVERCRGYLADPPHADWDGVYVMTKK